jgi:hypothetical protein
MAQNGDSRFNLEFEWAGRLGRPGKVPYAENRVLEIDFKVPVGIVWREKRHPGGEKRRNEKGGKNVPGGPHGPSWVREVDTYESPKHKTFFYILETDGKVNQKPAGPKFDQSVKISSV